MKVASPEAGNWGRTGITNDGVRPAGTVSILSQYINHLYYTVSNYEVTIVNPIGRREPPAKMVFQHRSCVQRVLGIMNHDVITDDSD